eukprot:21640-Eustigmatos_ZCMA.PRE.1
MLNYAPMAEQRATDGGSFYLEYHQVTISRRCLTTDPSVPYSCRPYVSHAHVLLQLTEEGLSVMADRSVAEGHQVFE